MAKQTDFYDATIMENGELVLVRADLFNLPYDKFDAEKPLSFLDDIKLDKAKGRQWPDLSNVAICGTFECSKEFTITADTKLPLFFTRLICEHAINSLDVLIGKLPVKFLEHDTPTVVVRTAILNNIKKNKDGAQDAAKKFVEYYPNVCVTDGKTTLAEILKAAEPVQAPVKIASTKNTDNVAAMKTEEWLSTDELVEYRVAASEEIAALPVAQVTRLVQMARSNKANLRLRTATMTRPDDGAQIVCVHRDDAARVVEYVLNNITQQDKEKTPKATATKAKPEKVEAPKAQKQTYFVGAREIRPIKIKKYISKVTWGQIQSKAGNSIDTLLNILQDIDNINVNPTDTNGEQVIFIKEKQVKISPTVKFKNSRCLCQGFGALDDRPRIVWEVAGNVFVCQKFFAEHENPRYNKYLRDANLDLADVNLSEFLRVSDLIKELSASKPRPDDPNSKPASAPAPVETPIAETPVDAKPTTAKPAKKPAEKTTTVADTIVQETEPVVTVATPASKRPHKRARIVRQTSAPVTPVTQQVAQPTTTQTEQSTDAAPQWQELYSLSHKYTQTMQLLDGRKKILLKQMLRETDTGKLLELTDKVQSVLRKKQACEAAIAEIERINKTLHDFQQQLGDYQM